MSYVVINDMFGSVLFSVDCLQWLFIFSPMWNRLWLWFDYFCFTLMWVCCWLGVKYQQAISQSSSLCRVSRRWNLNCIWNFDLFATPYILAVASSACVNFSCAVFIIDRQRARFHSGQPSAGNMMSQCNPKCLSGYAFWINVLLKLGFFWSTFFSPSKHFISSFIPMKWQHRLNEFSNLALICGAVLVYIILKCFQGSARVFLTFRTSYTNV